MAIQIQLGVISAGAQRQARINCTRDLLPGESLTGTPTVVERTTTDLTITSKLVNVAQEDDVEGETVAIGKCLLFFLVGANAGTNYVIDIGCGTTSSPDAETLVYEGFLECV